MRWACGSDTQVDPTLPCDPLPGRVIFVRLVKAGVRPIERYLFTHLTDPQAYPVADLVARYGLRWHGEVDYRQSNTTMDMDEFTAQTPEMFRKELAAGLLTSNLIGATLVQAAQRAQVAPNRLRFQRGLRRVRDARMTSVPAWVRHTGQLATYLLDRLAPCRLAHQPLQIAHEPRRVRRRPQVFPALKGDRNSARQQLLQDLGAVAHPAPAAQDADAPDRNESQRKAAYMKY